MCAGGTIAPSGGYVAGRADLIERVAARLYAPGIGIDAGAVSGDTLRIFYQVGGWARCPTEPQTLTLNPTSSLYGMVARVAWLACALYGHLPTREAAGAGGRARG